MKRKLIVLAAFMFAAIFYADAQTVNGIPIQEIDAEYVQIVGRGAFLNNKISVDIDFGQRNKAFKAKDTQIRDEKGKLAKFNSMVDALNFMSANGYEYVDSYVMLVPNQNANQFQQQQVQNVQYYLLRKKQE